MKEYIFTKKMIEVTSDSGDKLEINLEPIIIKSKKADIVDVRNSAIGQLWISMNDNLPNDTIDLNEFNLLEIKEKRILQTFHVYYNQEFDQGVNPSCLTIEASSKEEALSFATQTLPTGMECRI
jgi:hypothetical protein